MQLMVYQRWWGLLAVITVLATFIWFYSTTRPFNRGGPPPVFHVDAHYPPIPVPKDLNADIQVPPLPGHSNSRLLPFEYWQHRSLYRDLYTDLSCTKVPSVSDIQYAATSWQLLTVTNGSVYLYGAYWDDRFEEPLVRVIMYSDVLPLQKLYCQLWFAGDNEPQVELVEVLYAWEPQWGGYKAGVNEPYILACKARRHVPDPDMAPAAVSIVTTPCEIANNILNVQNSPFLNNTKNAVTSKNKNSVAVCVKWLHFRKDVSVNIVEWLQLLKHFGAEKAFIYAVKLHPNTKSTLQYYEDSGFVVVTDANHPPQVSGVSFSRGAETFQDYRRELAALNDCLYRNLKQYDWIAAIDMDELIVPERDGSWPELIKKEISLSKTSYLPYDALVFRNYYVLDGAQKDLRAPKEARKLAHTWRARTPSPPGYYVKSFFNTSSVTAMHNHTPLKCWRNCNKHDVNDADARLMHFREQCAEREQTCAALTDTVRDDVLMKWRPQVLAEIYDIMTKVSKT